MPAKSHQVSLLEAVFDHLVLPPKLPDAPEDVSIPLDWELSSRLIRACRQMQTSSSDIPWRTLEASLLLTRDLHHPVSIEMLMTAFSTLIQDDGANWLALHVNQQNAAIIIYKNKELALLFSENNPSCCSLTGRTGQMRWFLRHSRFLPLPLLF